MTSLPPWPTSHGSMTLERARGCNYCNLHHLAVFGPRPSSYGQESPLIVPGASGDGSPPGARRSGRRGGRRRGSPAARPGPAPRRLSSARRMLRISSVSLPSQPVFPACDPSLPRSHLSSIFSSLPAHSEPPLPFLISHQSPDNPGSSPRLQTLN